MVPSRRHEWKPQNRVVPLNGPGGANCPARSLLVLSVRLATYLRSIYVVVVSEIGLPLSAIFVVAMVENSALFASVPM